MIGCCGFESWPSQQLTSHLTGVKPHTCSSGFSRHMHMQTVFKCAFGDSLLEENEDDGWT
jgi:hypothetical protein